MRHKEEILRLHAEGKSYREIQSILGCSKGTIAYHCGTGQKEKTAKRNKDKRRLVVRYIQEYKQSHGCADCGENYPYWILEFDHCRGEKKFGICNAAALYTLNEIKEEIQKCDVVCSNCHKNRTWQRLHSSGDSVLDLEIFYQTEPV